MGETQVTWNGCGHGEVTGFYTDLCFRETKEAKMEIKVSLAPIARNWVPAWEQPERAVIGLGDQGGWQLF